MSRRGLAMTLPIIVLVAAAMVRGEELPKWSVTVAPGESIQGAIDAAPEGAVICLEEGEWEEHVTIGKSLTLLGSPGGTTIHGCEADVPVVRVRASGESEVTVVLIGLITTGGMGWDGPGLFIDGTARVTLADSIIQNNGNYGIHLRGASQSIIVASTIARNGSTGIFVSDNAQMTVACSTIEENGGSGISVEGGCATVMGSSVSRNRQDGICIRLSSLATVASSTVEENKYGIEMSESAHVTVSNSALDSNEYGGIVLWDSATIAIVQTRIVRSSYGIALADAACGDALEVFTGYVTGFGNTIPGPGEEAGSAAWAVCPDELVFLMTDNGGELDRRE